MPDDPNPKLTAARAWSTLVHARVEALSGVASTYASVDEFMRDADAHLRTALAEIDRLTAENAQLADEIAHPITCPACGSCGETGCCATPMCRYLNAHQGDYNEMVAEVERLTAALSTAHAAGRREGLEEAAKLADRRYAAWRDAPGLAGMTRAALEALESTGTAIRAFAAFNAKEPTHE